MKKKLYFIKLFFLSVLLSFSSCQTATENELDDWDKDNLRYLETDDHDVQKAQKKAQENLHVFEELFLEDTASIREYYLKAAFEEKDEVEHLWGILIEVGSNSYKIILGNEPRYLKSLDYGDTLELDKLEIEDFIVYAGDSIVIGDYISW